MIEAKQSHYAEEGDKSIFEPITKGHIKF